ncbi:hypothetical protein K437DRAFT_254244 [Tilletiaria anomala UBC 951]|uniref:Dynamin-type G domain-containing protein n=1 Tax=Tilletiaria anomala (strain ATCC 24038 / CBS 436.72 / UBC 951) TaxID=1037660 RepID=A0A066WIU2_TILAU|nr:uncharacterized protein K437DRAFT_254244 [Tilletiaria anomala UBC 951]KDN52463.1 hypothetical protein K437DRAFT_254244 [Tilletiaria anomala UBC 951]
MSQQYAKPATVAAAATAAATAAAAAGRPADSVSSSTATMTAPSAVNSRSTPYAPFTPSPLQWVRSASEATVASLEAGATTGAGDMTADVHMESEQEGEAADGTSRAYASHQASLTAALDKTAVILNELKDFNYGRWIVHYPEINPPLARASASHATQDDGELHRSTSSSDSLARAASPQPSSHAATVSAPSTPARHVLSRSYTQPPQRQQNDATQEHNGEEDDEAAAAAYTEAGDLSILRLDLKVGHGVHSSGPSSLAPGIPGVSGIHAAQSLVHSLEKSSVAQLLDGRMTQAIRHLEALRLRVGDKQSKVLVTGDLNAGKSTLVNSLLRRELMPTDQQPCTTVFWEVLDADEANDGYEEIHMLRDGKFYRREDESTYARYTLSQTEQIVAHAEELAAAAGENAMPPLIKCYCRDHRAKPESLLRSGVVDIALIDAPGLNRDSIKTTALFARQEEIDVVVFVVSAENHFTLSAKEFLWNASNDKAYVFIVVNKFDQIKNKDKCRRIVLEQIRQLSPRTYEDADELVHFVDSSAVFPDDTSADGVAAVALTEVAGSEPDSSIVETPSSESGNGSSKKLAGENVAGAAETATSPESNAAFARLETSLRDFVLLKRSKSKLLPAQTYILRLLSDIGFLARTNLAVAKAEQEEAQQRLLDARPALTECKRRHEKLSAQLEEEEERTVGSVSRTAHEQLHTALKAIARGAPAHAAFSLPVWPGLFDVWQYAEEVRLLLLDSLEAAVKDVEHNARLTTAAAVSTVKAIGEEQLPKDVERSNRVFLPHAMFSSSRNGHKVARRLYGRTAIRPGSSGNFAWLGLGPDVADLRSTDILDIPHFIQAIFPVAVACKSGGTSISPSKKPLTAEEEVGLAGSVTLGLGALTLVGGKALGAKAALEPFLRVFDLIGNQTARKWAGPILGLSVAAAVVYVIYDLPNSIPRNVGRSLHAAGMQPLKDIAASAAIDDVADYIGNNIGGSGSATFTALHTQRVSREVRKVMRLASYDLQETFRVAIAQRAQQVHDAETQEQSAIEAGEYFGRTSDQARVLRKQVDAMHIGDEQASA